MYTLYYYYILCMYVLVYIILFCLCGWSMYSLCGMECFCLLGTVWSRKRSSFCLVVIITAISVNESLLVKTTLSQFTSSKLERTLHQFKKLIQLPPVNFFKIALEYHFKMNLLSIIRTLLKELFQIWMPPLCPRLRLPDNPECHI